MFGYQASIAESKSVDGRQRMELDFGLACLLFVIEHPRRPAMKLRKSTVLAVVLAFASGATVVTAADPAPGGADSPGAARPPRISSDGPVPAVPAAPRRARP